jgi:hypothetical protein
LDPLDLPVRLDPLHLLRLAVRVLLLVPLDQLRPLVLPVRVRLLLRPDPLDLPVLVHPNNQMRLPRHHDLHLRYRPPVHFHFYPNNSHRVHLAVRVRLLVPLDQLHLPVPPVRLDPLDPLVQTRQYNLEHSMFHPD